MTLLNDLDQDVRHAFRAFARTPGFTAIVVIMLAIGIGANTSIFSFVNAVLLKPLPVQRPDNLFLLEKMRVKQVRPDTSFFYRQFEQIAKRKDLFSAVVAEQDWSGRNFHPFDDAGVVKLVMTQIVSPNYFSELGVKAIAGRVLTESDTATSNVPAVLSYQFWRSQFHGRSDIIGHTIRIKNYPFLIVGVLPDEFHSLDIERAPDLRLPVSAARVLTGYTATEPGGEDPLSFQILTRLAPGVSRAKAAAAALPEVAPMEEFLWRDWNSRRIRPLSKEELKDRVDWQGEYRTELLSVERGVSRLRDQFSQALVLLIGAVGLLLLAVCANIGGLLLAKSEERKNEIAVRLSLGAHRQRLLRQLLTENLCLVLPGAVLGIGLAYGMAPSLVKLLPNVRGFAAYATPRVLDVAPDARALLFALALSILSVLIFGTLPAWCGSRLDLNAALKGGGRSATRAIPGIGSIAIQVALSTILLAMATLMFRTFWNLEHLNPGFDRAHIVEFTTDPQAAGDSETQAGVFFRELKERVSRLPGVRSASYASSGVMRGIGRKTTVTPRGVILPQKTFLNTNSNSVTPDYFESMGIPLLAGRNLNLGDLKSKPERIVVNRAFADFFFPREDPIGKMIVQGVDGTKPPTAVIVGLVGTAKYRSFREADPPICYNVANDGDAGSLMYVRTYGDPTQLINAVRGVLRQLDPRVPLVEVSTLEQEVQDSLWQERLVSVLSGFFGGVALLLSAIGLYGALAYSVSRRFRELGIRIAVGAHVRHIVQTVCARLFLSVAIGLGVGVLAAAVLVGLARSLLFGVNPLDPVSFVIAAGVLLIFAIISAAIPARRAAKVDPMIALRYE
jgi:predicted permease